MQQLKTAAAFARTSSTAASSQIYRLKKTGYILYITQFYNTASFIEPISGFTFDLTSIYYIYISLNLFVIYSLFGFIFLIYSVSTSEIRLMYYSQ